MTEASWIGVAGIGILLALMFLGVPIAASLAIAGVVSYVMMAGWAAALYLLSEPLFNIATHYSLTALPMFIAMGLFAAHAGISNELFEIASKWLGRVPGALAVTTIATCAAFAAMCGSSIAATAAIGRITVPEMRRRHYNDALSTGCVAAAGALAVLIPPSTLLIIYGIVTEVSIGRLLIAGVIPGVLLAIMHASAAATWALLRPEDAPRSLDVVTLKEKVISLKGVWPLVITVVAVMGGLYAGVMSPTEAGAVGAVVTFTMLLLRRGLGHPVLESLSETVKVTCMVMLIIMCALTFGAALGYSGLPMVFVKFIGGLSVSPYVVVAMIVLIYLILGCIMDGLAMVLITIPIIYPVIISAGFDPIWFGVFIVMMVEMGQITPPVGLNIFVIAGIAPDVPMTSIFKGATAFLMSDIVVLVLLVAFPQIALYLPGKMAG